LASWHRAQAYSFTPKQTSDTPVSKACNLMLSSMGHFRQPCLLLYRRIQLQKGQYALCQ